VEPVPNGELAAPKTYVVVEEPPSVRIDAAGPDSPPASVGAASADRVAPSCRVELLDPTTLLSPVAESMFPKHAGTLSNDTEEAHKTTVRTCAMYLTNHAFR
jgi:hypothetical protein